MKFKKEMLEYGAKQLGKGARGAFGKLKKTVTTYKAKKAGSKRVPADLKKALEKSLGKARRASEVFPFVGAKTPKKVPLKKSGPTTIKGINIKTKAGKEFGEKIKNQPKRIAGQKPVGMREDLPTDIDVPSFLKKRPKKMKDGGGFPDLSGDNKITKKDILIGRGVIKKKVGGLVEATNKLKAQGLNMGGDPNKKLSRENRKRSLEQKKRLQNERIAKQKGAFGAQDEILSPITQTEADPQKRLKKTKRFADGGPVRGTARGMGAAIKGGGYNV